MERVLLTGASGFIGSNIAAYFTAKGIKVICFIRKTSSTSILKDLPVDITYGDITEKETIIEACTNIDCIIHVAAHSKDWGDFDEFHNVNVKGIINVLEAAKVNNIKNIILTGSISSYGEENSEILKNEKSPYKSHYKYFLDKIFPCKMNYYRDSKALSTREAINFCTKHGMNVSILEPVWVYGENEFGTGFYDYYKIVKSGCSFFPGSNKNKFHLIYVQDLARAYYQTYKMKLKGINRIIIGNQESELMLKFHELICRQLGVKKPFNIPKLIIYPLAFILELIYTVSRAKNPPLLTRGRVNMFYDNIEYSVKNAEILLSFKNEFSLEDGVRRTLDWYKLHELI